MTMPLFLLVLCFAPLNAAPAPAHAWAQDPVELGRLAAEQRQVAEQLRRLDALLEVLQARDLEEGREDRAKLLEGARARLAEANENGTDLATVVESLASELGALRTGNALEGQTALLATLQELLDYLIQSEREERERAFEEALADRGAKLDEFASRQQQLLERTRLLQEQGSEDQEGSSESSEENSEESNSENSENSESSKSENSEGEQNDESADNPEESAEQTQEQREEAQRRLAEEQAALAQEIEEFNQSQAEQLGRTPESSQRAEQKSREAAKELRQPGAEDQPAQTPEDLEEAEKKQQEALDALEQARQETAAQEQQNEQRKKKEALINVERSAVEILARHEQVDSTLQALSAASNGGPVPRSARARLRQASNEERDIADDAEDLLLEIQLLGADAFPFYLMALVEDHRRLAGRVGPPRYKLDMATEALSTGLIAGWESLIDAIRVEQERLRKQMEEPSTQPPPGQQPEDDQEDPLVGFAVELQLLKRMQQQITDSLERLEQQQATFAAAGISLGPEEVAELEMLLDRQAELQLQFESMIARLQGADDVEEAEDL